VLGCSMQRRILLQRQMRAHLIVIRRIGRKNSPQVRFTEDQHPVQALASYGANQTFCVAILPRRTWGDGLVTNAHGSQSVRDDSAICLHHRPAGPPRLVWINVTPHPTAHWIARQITEAFPWNEAPRYLLRDRDRVYRAGRNQWSGQRIGPWPRFQARGYAGRYANLERAARVA